MIDCSKVFESIDARDAIEFLKSLIRINSVTQTGNEKAVSEVIKNRIKESSLDIFSDEFLKNRENLIVSYKNKRNIENPKTLIFSGHFDTVPPGDVNWHYPKFGGELKENKLFGRGSTDMKSGLAAMIIALECIEKAKLDLNGEIRFVGTVGEEVDCIGARRIKEKGQIDDATAIVIGEPTANKVKIAHKGVIWLKISIFGKTAHGSMPSLGINAIRGMNAFINELEAYSIKYTKNDILGESTLNIGMINGGVSTNVVPDQCTIHLDIRTVPGQNHDTIEKEIKQLLEKVTKQYSMTYHIENINNLACVYTFPENPFIQLSNSIQASLFKLTEDVEGVNYYTDASIYRQCLPYVPILIYGPGEEQMAHQPDEWVDVQKYLDSIRFYISLAVNYLK